MNYQRYIQWHYHTNQEQYPVIKLKPVSPVSKCWNQRNKHRRGGMCWGHASHNIHYLSNLQMKMDLLFWTFLKPLVH